MNVYYLYFLLIATRDSLLFQRELQSSCLSILGCQHLFPKAYLLFPNLLPSHLALPKTWRFSFWWRFSHSALSAGRILPKQVTVQIHLESSYSQLIGCKRYPWRPLPGFMCIISMPAFSWEGKFSYDKQSQLMIKCWEFWMLLYLSWRQISAL